MTTLIILDLYQVNLVFKSKRNKKIWDIVKRTMESELVSGFMTEHAAVIFVFFFLAEYASIVLMCILNSILFLGGYLLNYLPLIFILQEIDYTITDYTVILSNPLIEGMLYGISLGFKSCIMVFTFI